MKLNKMAIAIALVFPLFANAQSSAQLQSEIETLKAQVQALQELLQGRAAGAAAMPAGAAAMAPDSETLPPVDPDDFNRIKTKVEAADDVQSVNGMKGLRIWTCRRTLKAAPNFT